MSAMIDPRFPEPDPERESRIVADIITLMKLNNNGENKQTVSRWLAHTLTKAQRFNRHPWWFARRLFSGVIFPGQDTFDLQGEMDKVIAAFCPEKLTLKPIGFIVEKRATAYGRSLANAGEPTYYALDSGRLHLWPAPDRPLMFCLSHTVRLTPSIIPPEWETYLVDGVIGLYGRHFDKSGLLEDAKDFAARFWEGIKASRSAHFDTELFERIDRDFPTNSVHSLSQAHGEICTTSFKDAVIRPSYDAAPGEIQILADKDDMANNTRGEPIAQIRG